MQIVKENEYFTVRVYPEFKTVTHQMHGLVETDNFKDMMLQGVAAYKKHECTKWLSDDSRNPMISQDDLAWARAEWEPQIIEAGWKCWAIVVPEKIFGKMAMRGVIQRYRDMGVNTEIFKSYEAALAWLKAQE